MSLNRLLNAEGTIAEKLDNLSPEDYDNLVSEMDITFLEHFAYQEAQSSAHASGKISPDEAQYIYAALGEVWTEGNGGWKDGIPAARKIVVTKAIGELIGARC